MESVKSSYKSGSERRAVAWSALAVLLTAARLSLAAAPDVSISPSVAILFVGEEKVVEGPVTAVQRENNVVHLRLGTPPQQLNVSLVIGVLNSSFPPSPEDYYAGKTVRVAGTIRSFHNVAEIVIRDAAAIEVVGSHGPVTAAAATAPVAAARPATETSTAPEPLSAEQRINMLTERVRQLEERVQQLEDSHPQP